MLLKDKNAIVYDGSRMVGSAVVRAFAREGPSVFLVGRTLATLDKVADVITTFGGRVETRQIDTFNEDAVNRYAENVLKKAGNVAD